MCNTLSLVIKNELSSCIISLSFLDQADQKVKSQTCYLSIAEKVT